MNKITQIELGEMLKEHYLWLSDNRLGKRLYLRYADLSGADLSGADLSGADFSGANLSKANLSKANLSGADIRYADLSGADLSKANLSGADIRYANLSKANLSGADLSGADLRYANLSEANLRYANLSEANLDFSCIPLWCGGLGIKADERICKQVMYHTIDMLVSSGIQIPESKDDLLNFANGSHVISTHGLKRLAENAQEEQ